MTGASGFIGGRLAARLLDRGDQVVALVRSPARAAHLRELGCTLVEGDLESEGALREGLDGCDSAFHSAAIYEVGVTEERCAELRRTNVLGTERFLDAAIDAGVKRIVYVSTNNVFGDTGGREVDESYERSAAGGFLSCYDETKYLAHVAAMERIARGAPIVIVQPGGVYGPGDHSQLGAQIAQAMKGSLGFVSFPDLGMNMVHVDDVASGILLAHDRGRVGESYILGGEAVRMRRLVEIAARVAGRKAPRMSMPTPLIRMAAPLGGLLARMGLPPNLREAIQASDGVTYWGVDGKARREIGYSPRDLETGLRQTWEAIAG